ncbi:F0F1 ATP synthase subunit delta [Patescibacteria group bacterium]|nr:F0F1 ATP synthase subunit delta [Patescibacteria group bacterium]MBU1931902.1 F0F1 ATP synthase subunit delta [Patescibacteria group bacterium]
MPDPNLTQLVKRQKIISQTLGRIEKLQALKDQPVIFVESCVSLTVQEKEAIITELSFSLNQQFILKEKVDSALLGGLKIRVGNLVIDNSLQGRLLKLKEKLQA